MRLPAIINNTSFCIFLSVCLYVKTDSKLDTINIQASTYFLNCLSNSRSQGWVGGGLKPILAVTGQGEGHTLYRLPINCRAYT